MANNGRPITLPEQSVPCCDDAESAFLGGYLICQGVNVDVQVTPEDFFILRNSYVWRAIKRLEGRKEPIDYMSVVLEVKTMGFLDDIGGMVYITDLVNSAPTSTHTDMYGQLVKRAAVRRKMITAADEIKRLAFEEEQTLELVASLAEDALFEVTNQIQPHKEIDIRQSMDRAASTLAERRALYRANPEYVLGFRTGFPMLDSMLDGLQRGDVNVWAGITSSGKTALFLTAMLYMAQRGIYHKEERPARVAYFSGEMDEEQVNTRLLSMMTRISARRISRGAVDDIEAAKIKIARDTIAGLPIIPLEAKRVSIGEIRAWVRRLKQQNRIDILWLDGLEQITPESKEEKHYLRISDTMEKLAAIALAYEISLNVTHQLNRKSFDRSDHLPKLSDLAGSSGVEKWAMRVIMLHREHLYDDKISAAIAKAYVRKNRRGPTGNTDLTFIDKWATFLPGQVMTLPKDKPAVIDIEAIKS